MISLNPPKNRSVFCKTEGEDTDGDAFGQTERLGAGDDGGTGGDDVVDDEEMPVADALAIGELEDLLDVLVALPASATGLAAFEDGASHHLIVYRETRDLTDASGDLHALVVASLSLTLTGQRYGHDGVDTLEEAAALDLSGQHASHHHADFRVILVFQLIDDGGGLGVGLIVEEGRGPLNRNLTPEGLGEDVLVGVAMVAGTWQVEVALAAEHLFGDGEATVAHHTETW